MYRAGTVTRCRVKCRYVNIVIATFSVARLPLRNPSRPDCRLFDRETRGFPTRRSYRIGSRGEVTAEGKSRWSTPGFLILAMRSEAERRAELARPLSISPLERSLPFLSNSVERGRRRAGSPTRTIFLRRCDSLSGGPHCANTYRQLLLFITRFSP